MDVEKITLRQYLTEPESNSYHCPAEGQFNYVGLNVRNRAHAYIGSVKRCGMLRTAQCTSARYEYLAIHIHESPRQRVRELANTPEFSRAQCKRKKVEASFAELENRIGLCRLRLRRLRFVREQFFLAARGPEHQTTGALPQPTRNPGSMAKAPNSGLPLISL